MADEFWEGLDLLGDPVPRSRGSKGRPPHIPTVENRQRVMLLLAHGWDINQIAMAIGVTPPTLRRHYFSELKQKIAARFRVEARRIEALYRQVAQGNVAAIKEANRIAERAALDELAKAHRQDSDADDDDIDLGKKARADRDAQTAHEGTGWGQLLPN